MPSISDSTMTLLQKVLDLRADNERVIASNIANSETPGYAPARFEFEEQLRLAVDKGAFAIKTTHANHLPVAPASLADVTGRVVQEKDTSGIGDQNGVSLDHEMLALAENELLYETAAQLLNKKLTIRKYIIQGGQ